MGQMRQIIRMALMTETRLIKRFLLDGIGNEPGGLTRQNQRHTLVDGRYNARRVGGF